ncbi:uncharacterized protein LOC116198859 [Punica granatum]|uniref:Serine-rich protein-like n=2 Tax=Punica granatum TaxID=22663 RepID=A0A218WB79_PUNGR|nr:uncharacterized protein LOC116198859 [Punica granatum]OWM69600.1 hypothetical protein CDL15_Pgr014061 [Punica granatum]PKI32783.1 hypothetical protein CRG98_046831 [Punica granatum]
MATVLRTESTHHPSLSTSRGLAAVCASSTSGFSSALSSSVSCGFATDASTPSCAGMRDRFCDQTPSSVHFSVERPVSSVRAVTSSSRSDGGDNARPEMANQKRTCLCSPTTHPGSFRCSMHKNQSGRRGGSRQSAPYGSSRVLNIRRLAMNSSIVRTCGVEGDLMKRAFSALMRPSLHQPRRRTGFEPGLSRLSIMSRADDI